MFKKLKLCIGIAVCTVLSAPVFAETGTSGAPQKAAIDVSSMVSQVDFSTVIVGIVAAGGALIGPRIAKMGIRFILGLFGK